MKKFPVIGSPMAAASELKGRVLTGGDLVYAQMGSTSTAPASFVELPPREIFSDALSRLSRKNPKVRVHVSPVLAQNQKLSVGLLLDGYMAWGQRHKAAKGESSKVALIGCIETTERIKLDVLIFEDRKLISIYDSQLPLRSDPNFHAAADSVISDILGPHPKASIFVTSTGSDLALRGAKWIGDSPVKLIRFRPIRPNGDARSFYWTPIGIAAAGVVFFSCAVGLGWAKLRSNTLEYDTVAESAEIKAHGGMDAGYVGIMTQRRLFMESNRRQAIYPDAMGRIAIGVSEMKDAKIIELKTSSLASAATPASRSGPGVVQQAAAKEKVADVWLQVSVPKVGDSSLVQGNGVIEFLAQRTKLSWKLVPQGWKDDGKRRVFTVEGDFNG